MARCGCAGTGCNCVLQNGTGTTVSGGGTTPSPYRVNVNIDPATDNLLTATAAGLLVDCDAVAACVAAQTPSGATNYLDSPGIDFTRTGSGTDGDPYVVTADEIPVGQKTGAATFTHALAGAAGAFEEITELGEIVVAVAGTYLVEYTGRGSAAIPSGSAALSTSTSVALAKNDAVIAGSEVLVAFVSQGAAGTAQPALQVQGTGTGSDLVVCAAGDRLSLYGARQPAAGGTNSILSNTDGRCRIVATRIGA